MASVHANLAFDTLAYSQALVARGFEQKQAEALAAVTRDYVISGLATNDFVQAAIQEAKTEINHKIEQEITEVRHEIDKVSGKIDKEVALLENRLVKSLGKLFFASVSLLAIIMPVIYMILQRLLPLAG